MWTGRGNTFFFDEWGWLEQRRSGLEWLLRPYNDHLQIVPVAAYQLLFHAVGLAHYWVFRLIQTLVHLGSVAVIFEFARRRLGWLAVPLVLPVAVLGSGWDYVLWPVSMGFVASIGLGVGALLALERDDRRGDILALWLLVAGLACCEFAAFFAVGVAVELTLRDRRLRRAWVWAVPLALYALWWLTYQQPTSASTNITAAPAFVAALAASGVGGLVGLNIVWGQSLVVAGVLMLAWQLARGGRISPRAVGLIGTIGAFWLVVALGRAGMGTPGATRYVYTSAILLVLFLAEMLRGSSLTAGQLGVAGLFLVFAVAGNIRTLNAAEGALKLATQRVSAELGALEVSRATAPPELVVDARYAPVLIAGPYLAAADELGSSAANTPREILRAPEWARAAADQLLVRAADLRLSPITGPVSRAGRAPGIALAAGGAAVATGPCVQFRPSVTGAALDLVLPFSGVEVRPSVGQPVQVRVRRFAASWGSPIAIVAGGSSTTIKPASDRSALPWYVRISSLQPVRVCSHV
jgi:hypothetical protein